MDFNLDAVKAVEDIAEGVYPLEILKVEEIHSTKGSFYLKFDYKVLGTEHIIRYDNCVITKNDGTTSRLGLTKLNKILKAVNSNLKGGTNSKIICSLLSGRGLKLKARLKKDGDYYKIDSSDMSFSHIESIDAPEEKTPEDFVENKEEKVDITVDSKW